MSDNASSRQIERLAARRREDAGFTLIEILVAITLLAIVLTLSVGALRHFWLVRALSGQADSVVTELRATQEKVVSESYPLVYGVRFDPGTTKWYVLKYDPVNPGTGDDTCVITERLSFGTGVKIQSASFSSDPYITNFCKTKTGAPVGSATVFFYPRGYATAGSVVLLQSRLNRTTQIDVAALTGRVTKQ